MYSAPTHRRITALVDTARVRACATASVWPISTFVMNIGHKPEPRLPAAP